MNQQQRDKLLLDLKKSQDELRVSQNERDQILEDLKKGQDELRVSQNERDQILKDLKKGQEELKVGQNERDQILKDLKKGQDELHNDQQEMRKDLNSLEATVTRIEYEHGDKLAIIFDAIMSNTQKLKEHDEDFKKIEKRLDYQSSQIYSKSSVQGL